MFFCEESAKVGIFLYLAIMTGVIFQGKWKQYTWISLFLYTPIMKVIISLDALENPGIFLRNNIVMYVYVDSIFLVQACDVRCGTWIFLCYVVSIHYIHTKDTNPLHHSVLEILV